jgi:hypothetical protein
VSSSSKKDREEGKTGTGETKGTDNADKENKREGEAKPREGGGEVNPRQGVAEAGPREGGGEIRPREGVGEDPPREGGGKVRTMEGGGGRCSGRRLGGGKCTGTRPTGGRYPVAAPLRGEEVKVGHGKARGDSDAKECSKPPVLLTILTSTRQSQSNPLSQFNSLNVHVHKWGYASQIKGGGCSHIAVGWWDVTSEVAWLVEKSKGWPSATWGGPARMMKGDPPWSMWSMRRWKKLEVVMWSDTEDSCCNRISE